MKHLINKTFVMIDIETVSTRQNAAIVSIGAVEFNILEGIKREFTVNIDSKSSKSFGMHIDLRTLEWWQKQSPEAKMAWQTDKRELPEALQMFVDWLGDSKEKMIIAEGPVFDIGILYSSFSACDIAVPWKFWNELDLRTIGTLLNVKMSTGNDHIALEDARNQTKQFIGLFED